MHKNALMLNLVTIRKVVVVTVKKLKNSCTKTNLFKFPRIFWCRKVMTDFNHNHDGRMGRGADHA